MRCRGGPGRSSDHQIGGLSHIETSFGQTCDDTDHPRISGGPATTENQSNVVNHLPTILARGTTAAVLKAFQTHDIVMLGEIHWNKQEHEWLDSLVANPEFADRADDIVMEIGNHFIRGQERPFSIEPMLRQSVLAKNDTRPVGQGCTVSFAFDILIVENPGAGLNCGGCLR
jgi:hypothetical protein